jgi:hypothetical protein
LLKQQTAIITYRLPTKKNKLPFSLAENKRKFAVSVFHLRQTNESCCFPLVSFSVDIYIYLCNYMYVYISMCISIQINAAVSNGKQNRLLIVQTEICRVSVCLRRNRRKLSVCKRTFGLNGLKRTCLSILLRTYLAVTSLLTRNSRRSFLP